MWQVLFLVCNHLLKWKSFPFRWRVVQICIYLCTVWFSIIPSNQFFPFQSACLGQMKHLEGTQARGQNFSDTWILSLGIFPWIHCKPHRYVPPQRIWFLRFFGLKTGITLCSFWFGIGYGFRGKKRRITNVFVVSIPN